jgi:hypothetical protein
MTTRRRLFVWLLLATSLVGATTAHHHSILEDASAPQPASVLLDPRCDLAGGLSLHAIHRIVERETCWACHWQRQFAAPFDAPLPEPVSLGRLFVALPPPTQGGLTRLASPSRGPPPPSL